MSEKITSPEKDPIKNLFWVFAIHYQILKTAVPNRCIPEEAYSPANMSKPTYTLEDLIAQIPDDTSQDEAAETTVPNRSIPEEAYSPANMSKPTYTLADLIAQITEDNLHNEVDTGPAVGNEV